MTFNTLTAMFPYPRLALGWREFIFLSSVVFFFIVTVEAILVVLCNLFGVIVRDYAHLGPCMHSHPRASVIGSQVGVMHMAKRRAQTVPPVP